MFAFSRKFSLIHHFIMGYTGVLILVLISSIISLNAVMGFYPVFKEFHERSHTVLLTTKVEVGIKNMQIKVHKYLREGDNKSLVDSRRYLDSLMKEVDHMRTISELSLERKRLSIIYNAIDNYRNSFENIVDISNKYKNNIREQVEEIEFKILKNIEVISDLAKKNNDLPTIDLISKVRESLLLGALNTSRFIFYGGKNYFDLSSKQLKEAKELLSSILKRPGLVDYDTILGEERLLFERYCNTHKLLGAQKFALKEEVDRMLYQYGQIITEVAMAITKSAAEEEEISASESLQRIDGYVLGIWILVPFTFFVIALIVYFMGRAVVKPLQIIRDSMNNLAKGRYDFDTVSFESRNDELGQMAEAVRLFRNNALSRKRLENDKEREHQLRVERQDQIEEMIAAFSFSTQELLQSVGDSMKKMRTTAKSVQKIAKDSDERAAGVVVSAEQASSNVHTVASAASELFTLTEEIATKLAKMVAVVARAAKSSHASSEKVASLDQAAQKIGLVISVINDVAERTNLLALNATIEAARAGEAGKGFAVVASEVRNLSDQTAQSASEIAQQVKAIQALSGESVDIIAAIASVTGEVDEHANRIADSIKAQRTAIENINISVKKAASETNFVAKNVAKLCLSASNVNRSAGEADSMSARVMSQMNALRGEIDKFLSGVMPLS